MRESEPMTEENMIAAELEIKEMFKNSTATSSRGSLCFSADEEEMERRTQRAVLNQKRREMLKEQTSG